MPGFDSAKIIEKLSEAVETVALRDDIISLLVRQPFSFLADFLSGHVKRAGSMPGLCRDLMRQPRFLQYL